MDNDLEKLVQLNETWSKGVGDHKTFDFSNNTPIKHPQGPSFTFYIKNN
jgi:hypothetical protein